MLLAGGNVERRASADQRQRRERNEANAGRRVGEDIDDRGIRRAAQGHTDQRVSSDGHRTGSGGGRKHGGGDRDDRPGALRNQSVPRDVRHAAEGDDIRAAGQQRTRWDERSGPRRGIVGVGTRDQAAIGSLHDQPQIAPGRRVDRLVEDDGECRPKPDDGRAQAPG